jgi:hypothetical protein
MQERRQFYNGSVIRRRALRFTGEGRRYVVQMCVRQFGLTVDQVTLHPTMDVSDSTSLHLPLKMLSARRAHHR